MKNVKKAVAEGVDTSAEVFLIPAVSQLVSAHPEWWPAWSVASGIYLALAKFRQNRINDRVEELADFIMQSPSIFAGRVVETEEFKDGFIVTLEAYCKQRNERKRHIIQRILVGFTCSRDQEQFDLERLYSVVDRISIEAVQYLGFIRDTIFPFREEFLLEKAQKDISEAEKVTYMARFRSSAPISQFINAWIHENFSPNEEKMRTKLGVKKGASIPRELLDQAFVEEKEHSEQFIECASELISLGVLRVVDLGSGTLGGGPTSGAAFTQFGERFLKFLED